PRRMISGEHLLCLGNVESQPPLFPGMKDTNTLVQFGHLWRVLAEMGRPAAPDLQTWASLPTPGQLPLPWLTWTLIALVRHRERQIWVDDVIRVRLDGDLLRIARAGAMGHPEGRP